MTRLGCIAGAAVMLSGCEFSIAHPGRMFLLLLVPALVAAGWAVQRRRRVLLERFAGPAAKQLVSHLRPWRRTARIALLSVGTGALIVALAGFRVGYRWENIYRRGVDIMIVLDVSRSMDARDADGSGKLSRLVRAKREIVDLLDKLQGDRVGVVAFAGTAVIRCPLTNDYRTVALLLEGVDSELVSVQGTNIGEAIDLALEGFERGPGKSQAILLITDGEDHLGEVDDAARRAEAQGVRIFAIGVGRPEGAPVPAINGGFHTDRAGEVVVSRLEESALESLAVGTGGSYVRSVTGDVDLEQIYLEGIRGSVESRDFDSKRDKRWYDRFQWLVALSLFALALEPFVSDGGRP